MDREPLSFGAALRLAAAYQALLLGTVLSVAWFRGAARTSAGLRDLFANWDAVHYLAIADHGYGVNESIVFFPLYPLLISALNGVLSSVVAAALISNLASIVGHAAFFVFAGELGLGRASRTRVAALLCASPIMVHFANGYSEGLFLGLSGLFMLALQRGRMASALGLGILASATRVPGVLFAVPFALANLEWRGRRPVASRWFWATPLIASGYGLYLYINRVVFGDPFHYLIVQRTHWLKDVANPLLRYRDEFVALVVKGALGDHPEPLYVVDVASMVAFPLVALGYLWVSRRDAVRVAPHWIAWSAAQYAVFASATYWLSSTRLLCLVLPLYLMLERLLRPPALFALAMAMSTGLGLLAIARFSTGGWAF